MIVFNSIAVVLVEYEFGKGLEDYLNKSLLITKYLSNELHVFVKSTDLDQVKAKLLELTSSPPQAQSTVVAHPLSESFTENIFDTIGRYACELLILPKRREISLFATLLERTSLPVFIIKDDTEISFPLHSIFVPLSGETRRSSALEFALRMASRIGIPIDLIHVTCGGEGYCTCCDETLMENLSDQFYYEYAQRMDKILAESCPFSTFEERKWVREICGCTGDIAEQVTQIVSRFQNCALVLEWNGVFVQGRAQRLRKIFEKAHCPILLVRAHKEILFTLKVAKDFKAA